MPNPNVNRRNADEVRNVLANVENLYNQPLVDRAFEDGAISSTKIEGGTGLSRYSNTVVVDINGNGDYTTIPDAIADVPDNTLISVMNGLYSIPSTQVIDKNIGIKLEVFAQVFGAILVAPMFDIQGSNQLVVQGENASVIFAQFGVPFQVSGPGQLRLANCLLNAGGGVAIVDIQDADALIDIRYNNMGGVDNAILTVGPLTTSDSIIAYNVIDANVNAINSTIAWPNAPVYYNILGGGTTNVTPNAGVANGNNVDV